MRRTLLFSAILLGATVMTQTMQAATPYPATDPRIYPQVRAFLKEINKTSSPFWELPQPKPQDILTGLQNKTPVYMSGVCTTEQTITQDGQTVKIYIMKPEQISGKPVCCCLFMVASGLSEIFKTTSALCETWSSARARSACSSNTPPCPRRCFPLSSINPTPC